MSLKEFIETYPGGRAALAKALGRSVEALRLWESGDRTPSSTTMNRIIEISGGALTPNDFFTIPKSRRVA